MATKQLHVAKWGGILCLVMALVLLLGPMSTFVQSATVPTVHVWEAETQVIVGRTGHVDIKVDDVRDLYAVELLMQYDPAILGVMDDDAVLAGIQIQAGNIFDGLGWHTDLNHVNPATGAITYMFALDSQSMAGVNGSGILARINFAALAPGASQIELVSVMLVTREGHAIEHNALSGRVRVVEIPFTVTPTPDAWISPTPTNTPPPPATSTPGAGPTVPAEVTPTPTENAETEPSATPTTQPTPVIFVDPEIKYVMPGTDAYVDVRVANASGLYAAWTMLHYDPSILAIQDSDPVAPGVQVEAGSWFDGKSWYPVANLVDPVAGTITFGAKLSFSEAATRSEGILARIHFRGIALGLSPMDFAEVILADQQGTSIDAAERDGTVIVTSIIPSATPTPSVDPVDPTPTPTPNTQPCCRPVLYLEPEAVDLVIGGEKSVDVMVADAADLYGVQFSIDYDPAVIEILDLDLAVGGIQLAYGDFLVPDSVAANGVDAGAGRMVFAISQAAPRAAANGTGVVATLRVRAVATGATSLAIHTTQLLDSMGLSMAHTAAGGFVAVNSQTVIGRVYLQGRTLHAGSQILWDGVPMATTGDDGGFAFACPVSQGYSLDVSAVKSGHLTATLSVDIPADSVVDLGDAVLAGGDCVGPQVELARSAGCAGDATVIIPSGPDGHINILDLTFVASYFGATSNDADWAPSVDGCHPEYVAHRADTNGDQVCNIFDLVQVGNNFGLVGDQPWQ